MEFDEKIFQDHNRWIRYTSDEGDICIYKRCPTCGKFIKIGKVMENIAGQVKLIDWNCKKCGKIEPFYLRD